MTLAQVRGYGAALARLEAERLKAAAIAARAGRVDEQGWSAWMRSMDDGRSAR